MQQFYIPNLNSASSQFDFAPDESKHIVRVLRKKEGDILYATNGKGQLFQVRILQAHPRQCRAQVLEVSQDNRMPYRLHLAVAPTKNTARFEWFLEKATEIGVAEITPLLCERSERQVLKNDRLQRIVESAMKQSLRTYLPQLNSAMSLDSFLGQDLPGLLCVAHCAEHEKTELKDIIGNAREITVLIGPEGDFSGEEIQRAVAGGFQPVSLGRTRLRTETAAIMAAATAAVVLG